MIMQRDQIDDIPLLYTRPTGDDRHRLIIWLNGDKTDAQPTLEEFATLGDTGIAFDPHQHGELMVAGVDESHKRVRSNICRDFWPILAQTAREIPLVIYWSLEKLDLENQVGLGGISMGGDVSIIACDLDQRIELAVPWIATPDWLRPGTCESVGAPDEKAQADYDELNPLTYLDRYAHCPRIVFQNGAVDPQVPPNSSGQFRDALRQSHYKDCPERIEGILYPDIDHQTCDAMLDNTVRLFKNYLQRSFQCHHSKLV